MHEPDRHVERLVNEVNEFFAAGYSLREAAFMRWHTRRELDPVTALPVRSWSVDRALGAFELSSSAARRHS
ncbi:hypothetical protein [Streptomyces noursei]|uniref:hypothetical protein n=1 Tax=Streptomyces noursei TaxID=1971 RepID=UPI0013520C3F